MVKKFILIFLILLIPLTILSRINSNATTTISKEFLFNSDIISNIIISKMDISQNSDILSKKYNQSTFEEIFDYIINIDAKKVNINFLKDRMDFNIIMVVDNDRLFHFEISKTHIIVTEREDIMLIFELSEQNSTELYEHLNALLTSTE